MVDEEPAVADDGATWDGASVLRGMAAFASLVVTVWVAVVAVRADGFSLMVVLWCIWGLYWTLRWTVWALAHDE